MKAGHYSIFAGKLKSGWVVALDVVSPTKLAFYGDTGSGSFGGFPAALIAINANATTGRGSR